MPISACPSAPSEPVRRYSLGAWRAELLPRQSYEAAYTADRWVIGFAFEGQMGAHAFASDRQRPFSTRPNSLALVAPGCEVFSRSTIGGEYLVLSTTEAGFSSTRPHFNDVIDTSALAAARHLRRFLLAPRPDEALDFEHQALRLAERVRHVLDAGDERMPSLGWMTPKRLRQVEDLIQAGLETGITIAGLAGALGLSDGYFFRAFKAAMGVSPHDYILDRRVARARCLLTAGDMGLSEVAFAAGFASHAHLSAVFRRRLGLTPSALRSTLRTG